MENERGSIPLVLVVVFTFAIAVTALTQLFLSEAITARDMAKAEANRFYEFDKTLEIATNLTIQKLKSKEWEDDFENEYFLSKKDLLEIEQALNEELLPFESSDETVLLTHTYSGKLSDYCESLYEISLEEDEGDFLTNSCVPESSEITFTLSIQSGNLTESFDFTMSDFYPVVTNTGEYIELDLSRLKIGI